MVDEITARGTRVTARAEVRGAENRLLADNGKGHWSKKSQTEFISDNHSENRRKREGGLKFRGK